MNTPQNLNDERQRHALLRAKPVCTSCGAEISLVDALSMVQGDGFVRYVSIRRDGGDSVWIKAADFNPQTMVLIDDGTRPAVSEGGADG